MDNQDRRAIEELFGRLSDVERQAGPRDAEAETFIRQRIGSQPGAPYFMAQTIVMQTAALETAQRRIEELERKAAAEPAAGASPASGPSSGPWAGILGGRAGRGSLPAMGPGQQGNPAGRGGSPMPAMGSPSTGPTPPAARGGGFLAGAAQTAMGVAGGMLLGNALAGMFGGGSPASAAEPSPVDEPAAEEPEAEGGGFFDSLFGGDGGEENF